ncbi:hypothetical protein IF1G_07823 [Cordyceps javanica]|uniref:Uncharacterized protein n=1 Tax=Cordyceps javanica TaxID=43265 RepID=A0A545VUQ3_9HYPO|nr:hypothetical protein IF1G_07823 [Cordyceps javanica]TQW05394.1 hypothetical protein IF2G_07331 [Cordyceps javanica]
MTATRAQESKAAGGAVTRWVECERRVNEASQAVDSTVQKTYSSVTFYVLCAVCSLRLGFKLPTVQIRCDDTEYCRPAISKGPSSSFFGFFACTHAFMLQPVIIGKVNEQTRCLNFPPYQQMHKARRRNTMHKGLGALPPPRLDGYHQETSKGARVFLCKRQSRNHESAAHAPSPRHGPATTSTPTGYQYEDDPPVASTGDPYTT